MAACSWRIPLFVLLALHGINASTIRVPLRSERGAFLGLEKNADASMLETARADTQRIEEEGMVCIEIWFFAMICPLICFFWLCCSGADMLNLFLSPCISGPLLIFNIIGFTDLVEKRIWGKLMKGEHIDSTCLVVLCAIVLQAFLGFISIMMFINLSVKAAQQRAKQQELQDAMKKAAEDAMRGFVEQANKQAVIKEMKAQQVHLTEALDEEHKTFYASDEFKAKCDAIFDGADTNKNGVIDRNEFQAALSAALDDDMIPLYKDEFFAAFDMDNNNTIDREEFTVILKYIDCHGPAELKEKDAFVKTYLAPEVKVVAKCKLIKLPAHLS